MTENLILIIILSILILENLFLILRITRPHGLMHIDEYTNKDVYRMVYFIPVDDIKKHRRLILKVEEQQWSEEYRDIYEEEYL